MILLVGFPQDSVLRYYAKYLYNRGVSACILNLHDFGDKVIVDDIGYHCEDGMLKHSSIVGVFSRLFLSGEKVMPQKRMDMFHELYYYIDHFYKKVVNKPTPSMHNFSKLWQQCALEMSPLETIPSVVSIHNKFRSRNSIMKSISAHRSVCRPYELDICHEPVVIQRDMGRANIRVHCVGNQVHAQRVFCSELDYRYAKKSKWQTIQMPEEVNKRCIEIKDEIGLVICGIDLIMSEGKYYLLEANPSPGYTYFESFMARTYISDAITDYFLSERF